MRRIAPTSRTLRRPDRPLRAAPPGRDSRLRRSTSWEGARGLGGWVQAGLVLDVGAGRIEREHGARGGSVRADGGMRGAGSRRVDVIRNGSETRRKCPLAVSDDDDRLDASRGAPSRTAHSTRVPARADRPPAMGSCAIISRPSRSPVASRVVARERPAARLVPRTRRRPPANAPARPAPVAVSECTSGGILAASLLSRRLRLTGAAVAYPLARGRSSRRYEALPNPRRLRAGDNTRPQTATSRVARPPTPRGPATDVRRGLGVGGGAAGLTFHPLGRLRVRRRRRDRPRAPPTTARRLIACGCAARLATRGERNMWQFAAAAAGCAHDASGMARSRGYRPGGLAAHWKRRRMGDGPFGDET